MSSNDIAEDEIIQASANQRAFFEKVMPGMKLYPYQEAMIAAILNGDHKRLIISRPARSKTMTIKTIQEYLKDHEVRIHAK